MPKVSGTFAEDSMSNGWIWGDIPVTRIQEELELVDVELSDNCGVYPDESNFFEGFIIFSEPIYDVFFIEEKLDEPCCDIHGYSLEQGENIFDESTILR